MGYLFSFLVFLSFNARADFFGFGSDKSLPSKIPPLVEKLQKIEIKNNLGFEDEFNGTVKSIETAVEDEKLFCSGEASDAQGRVLPADQKQLCFRELKKNYLSSTTTIFEVKKKFLTYLHGQQLEKLDEIQKKLRADIEKNF